MLAPPPHPNAPSSAPYRSKPDFCAARRARRAGSASVRAARRNDICVESNCWRNAPACAPAAARRSRRASRRARCAPRAWRRPARAERWRAARGCDREKGKQSARDVIKEQSRAQRSTHCLPASPVRLSSACARTAPAGARAEQHAARSCALRGGGARRVACAATAWPPSSAAELVIAARAPAAAAAPAPFTGGRKGAGVLAWGAGGGLPHPLRERAKNGRGEG
jgi:hypothetical protein